MSMLEKLLLFFPDLWAGAARFGFNGQAQGDASVQGFLQTLLHLRQLQFQIDSFILF